MKAAWRSFEVPVLVDMVELLRAAGEPLCRFSLVVLGPNPFLRNRHTVVYSFFFFVLSLLVTLYSSFPFSAGLQTTTVVGSSERENAFIHDVRTGWQPNVSSPSLSFAKGRRHKANNNDGKYVITDRNVNNLLQESKTRKKLTTNSSYCHPFFFFLYPETSFSGHILLCLSVNLSSKSIGFNIFPRCGSSGQNRLQQPPVKYIEHDIFTFHFTFTSFFSFASVIICLCGSAIYRSSSRRCAVGLRKKHPSQMYTVRLGTFTVKFVSRWITDNIISSGSYTERKSRAESTRFQATLPCLCLYTSEIRLNPF